MKARYDERNQADYVAMTKQIESALKVLSEDSSIPATEHCLAELAGCSRGTLRNRVFPLEKLKEIKRERVELRKNKPTRITLAHRIAVDVHIKDKKDLKNQLEKSRDEAAVWFDKYLQLEAELRKYRRVNEVLQKGKKLLEEKNREYKDLLSRAGISVDLQEEKKLHLVRT